MYLYLIALSFKMWYVCSNSLYLSDLDVVQHSSAGSLSVFLSEVQCALTEPVCSLYFLAEVLCFIFFSFHNSNTLLTHTDQVLSQNACSFAYVPIKQHKEDGYVLALPLLECSCWFQYGHDFFLKSIGNRCILLTGI